MGVQVDLSESAMMITLTGWDVILAMRRRLRVGYSDIVGVRSVERRHALAELPPLRLPGSYLPGVITAGTYRGRRRSQFWCVRRAAQVLCIDLAPGHRLGRIVLQVTDPDRLARLMARKTAGRKPAAG